mgnify:FL=1
MRRQTKDQLINEAFDLLLKGLTPKEIKHEMFLTEDEWRYMCSSARFMALLHSSQSIPQKLKIKEIEENLFGLLSLPNRDYLTNKRIDALTHRYATILL